MQGLRMRDRCRVRTRTDAYEVPRVRQETRYRPEAQVRCGQEEGWIESRPTEERQRNHVVQESVVHVSSAQANRGAPTHEPRILLVLPDAMRKRLTDDELRARQKARFDAWYAKHRESVLERRRAYRAEHADEINAKERARRKAKPVKRKRRLGPHPRSEADWYYQTVSLERRKERMRTDPEFYARLREQNRRYQKKRVDRTRKRKFAERPAGRIPDWMTKADVTREVARSAFYWANADKDTKMARRDFHVRKMREKFGELG